MTCRLFPALRHPIFLATLVCVAVLSRAAEGPPATKPTTQPTTMPDKIFAGLKVRCIGPALMSGRIADIAVNSKDSSQYYVAVASGGVWKTSNAGITWSSVFDKQGSYSIGCVTLDPRNPNVVWVGAGENNSQRSVGFGDGVYRSRDGGQNWENVGLKASEHIGRIVVHPANSDIVYVAAQGPLWKSGGDRGLYKTIDGGKTWQRILHISDDTGINEVYMDPRDANVLYASAYQRRRHVWTLIDGGPESGIHKSTDGGRTWRKITSGIPEEDKGRIGLAVSPANPDVVYAVVEAADGKGGFFRSTDRGETWQKRSDYVSNGPQYFNEIFCDPILEDRVYAIDVNLQVTENGGKTFQRVGGRDRHVDDHVVWINPANNRHLLVGGDGGLYETLDRGENWRFSGNLPVTQFYRVSTDNAAPFYNVYGGTQDNASQGGPSRTTDRAGITSADWFTTVGGDGYETVVDPKDSNVLYCLWQYGGLVRHDRRSGEITDIKPREAPGEPALKWNWDSPLVLSPHNSERLYFAANQLFRSDDRGNSWRAISGDLTRGIDRNMLPVMGKIQSVDAVARHKSTSFYGNATALCESPVKEDVMWVGTDDGLVHVTLDAGKNWRTISSFPGVPNQTYVSGLTASRHAVNTVYACFDNHKNGDFKPYLLKSTDLGQTWTPITGDLPERQIVYCLQEDHEKADLLFVGTEFGAYLTVDGGKQWTRVGGLPTIAVRDIELQRRENDVVLGTFGRSFYILDDYSPLRQITPELTNQAVHLFPVKDALRYIERSRLGGRTGRGSQGASFYTASNPPFGAVFTYYLKEKVMTQREQRREAEKKTRATTQPTQPVRIPSLDELRKEDNEVEPQVLLIVRDEQGQVLRRIQGNRDGGLHRIAWDLRHPSAEPVRAKGGDRSGDEVESGDNQPKGPLALPGAYSVSVVKVVDGQETALAGPVLFNVIPLEIATFAAKEKGAVLAFQKKVARLQRAVEGAVRVAEDSRDRLNQIRRVIVDTPRAEPVLLRRTDGVIAQLQSILVELRGDPIREKFEEPAPPSIRGRVQNVVGGQWYVTSPPTQTQRDDYRYASEAFEKTLANLRDVLEKDLKALEAQAESVEAPWTPGRIPVWTKEAE